MSEQTQVMAQQQNPTQRQTQRSSHERQHPTLPIIPVPLPNYTLSTVCPACETPTFRLACKVRCARCGFMWDCSEL